MSHIPQLGEEIEGATRMLGAAVGHAHIANAVLLQEHPLYGDMHPPFGTAGGHYAAADIGHFLDALGRNCFSQREEFSCGRPVVSLEIRPYPAGQTAERVLSEAAQLADAVRASRRRG
jgi:hypothetical protein